MALFNDAVILNMFIPKLIILGVFCFFITQTSLLLATKYQLLKFFWHPRLIVWSYAVAIYAMLVIFITSI